MRHFFSCKFSPLLSLEILGRDFVRIHASHGYSILNRSLFRKWFFEKRDWIVSDEVEDETEEMTEEEIVAEEEVSNIVLNLRHNPSFFRW